MQTQYELYRENLDRERVNHEIISSGTVIARGVAAPYEGAPTPCVAAQFPLIEPNLQYVYTDALTGCAGIIAISGDAVPPETDFKSSSVLIIHDKGGDNLNSSEKLLEEFIIAEQKAGHTRMRLIWGNGVIEGAVLPTHEHITERMVGRLAQNYPHLDIKHLPNQMVLVADKQGNPLNLSGTPLAKVPTMDRLNQMSLEDICLKDQVDLKFDRPFQKEFIPTIAKAEKVVDHRNLIDAALKEGKFPPIWLLQSNESLKAYLDTKTAKLPSEGQAAIDHNKLIEKFKNHSNSFLKEIGKKLDDYTIRHGIYSWSSSNASKAELMSRKYWALLCMGTELMEGLDKKPVRKEIFDQDFLKKWIPKSMNATFSSKASSFVEKAKKFVDSQRIKTIDGSKKPEQTFRHDAKAPETHRSTDELSTTNPKF